MDSSALTAILFREPDGERFAIAPAIEMDEPLLFSGADFARTDVGAAL